MNSAQVENAPIRGGNSPPFDLGSLGKELEDGNSLSHAPTLVPPLQRNQTFPFQEITNTQSSLGGTTTPSQATWKRFPRIAIGPHLSLQGLTGSKQPFDMNIDHCELPSKKILVSNNDKENIPLLVEAVSAMSCLV